MQIVPNLIMTILTFFHSNSDDYVEHFKVIFNDYNTNVVEIKDVSTNKVYTFTKYTFEMGSIKLLSLIGCE